MSIASDRFLALAAQTKPHRYEWFAVIQDGNQLAVETHDADLLRAVSYEYEEWLWEYDPSAY